MNNVHGIQPAVPPEPIEPVSQTAMPAGPAAPGRIDDVVELSPVAQLVAKVHEIPLVRAELVQRVRAELASGTYETTEKLDIAVSRLMEELLPEL